MAVGFHCRELEAFVEACRAPAHPRSLTRAALASGIAGAALA